MKEFDTTHQLQLAEKYPADIVDQITTQPLQARSSTQTGIDIPYVHVRPIEQTTNQRPIFVVPGLGEGIINKAPLVAELADRGYEVIMPGQNRKGIVRDAGNKRSATRSQAMNCLDVLNCAHPDGADVDVVSHSYGSLVFQAMTRLQPASFDTTRAVLLAPAGSIADETLPALGKRWLQFQRSEASQNRPMEFPDPNGATGKASVKTLAANIPRMLLELGDLAHNKVDYIELAQRVASVAILSYAEDAMFPEDKLYRYVNHAVHVSGHAGNNMLNISWATPVDSARVASGELSYGGQGAVHDDEQFNPSRVVASISQLLQPLH